MLLPLLCAALSLHTGLQSNTASVSNAWYGPATAKFGIFFDGNPFDPDQNDVRAKFTNERGESYERLAYFDGNGFSSTLVAPTPGHYKAVLYRNGKPCQAAPAEPVLEVIKPLPFGYIHRDPIYTDRLRWDSGQPYYPIGIDLAWRNDGQPSLPEAIGKLAAAGANWCRIWACSFDGKNPWWPNNDPRALPDQLWLPALNQWATIEAACDTSGLPFQMTLFHHGLVSTTTDSNWADNPWNSAKGGFLKDPADFFTDPESKRKVKMWLRYAVARYAASPNLVGWELFNEVQWVDAMKTRVADVAAWHQEMADYIRSIDPYHHLVTSSSTLDHPELLVPLDYLQPHTYPNDIAASILGTPIPKDKPVFYGEFGPGGKADNRQAMRDGIYAGMLANQAGAGEYWFWDIVERENLYGELTKAQAAAKLSDVANHPLAHPARLIVDAPGGADLTIQPGAGWEKARKLTFALPREARLEDTAGLPQFVQGQGHRDMFPDPLELDFNLSHRGVVKIKIGKVARSGASIRVADRDTEIVSKSYPPTDQDIDVNELIQVSLSPGPHHLKISNPGADWFTLESVSVPGIGTSVNVYGLEDQAWLFIRMKAAVSTPNPLPIAFQGSTLPEGSYRAELMDLDSGAVAETRVSVNANHEFKFNLVPKDAVLVLKP